MVSESLNVLTLPVVFHEVRVGGRPKGTAKARPVGSGGAAPQFLLQKNKRARPRPTRPRFLGAEAPPQLLPPPPPTPPKKEEGSAL